MHEPKVSVLIPVYNTGKTLGRTLDSVLSQTLKEIEIVCVDDGSDEETKAVLRGYAAKDARVRAIENAENEGTMAVRKKLIEAARGEYIMFLDSDDAFYPYACEKAYNAVVKNGTDIAQFGTEFVWLRQTDEAEQDDAQKYMRVHEGKITGKNVFRECFSAEECLYGFTLWNKIYKTPLLKRAAGYIPGFRAVMAEDFFLYFVAAYFARSYFGFSEPLVKYSFGEGVSTEKTFKSGYFELCVARKRLCDALLSFLQGQKEGGEMYFRALGDWESRFFHETMYCFDRYCGNGDGAVSFDALVRAYGAERVIGWLAENVERKDVSRLARLVRGADCLRSGEKPIKTVAFFYHRIYNGGVERALSELIPKFISRGYKTVLFVEEESKDDYALPAECKKYILPCSDYRCPKERYGAHMEALVKALRDSGADVLLYQSASSPWLLHDVLAAKTAGVRTFITQHEMLPAVMLYKDVQKHFAERFYVYRLADGVQNITQSDAAVLRAAGVNAQFIPNPYTYPIAEEKRRAVPEILWVGRLDPYIKRPEYAVLIMREVVKKLPEAKLNIVGKAETAEQEKEFLRLIEENGLENNIELCGFIKDPSPYYKNCGVLLVTSACESWGMVLCEAMSFGMPGVCFDMPYLETLKENEGVARVPQGDVFAAAEEIVKLLTDEALYQKRSAAAYEAAKRLAAADLRGGWERLLSGRPSEEDVDAASLALGVRTVVDFFDRGFNGGAEREHASARGGVPLRGTPLWKKAAKFWVDKGTFALIRKGMLYTYKKLFRRKK